MSETNKPSVDKSNPAFNKEALKAHLDKVVDSQQQYVGKPNHNPFFWIKDNVAPLVERLDKGEQTSDLSAAIMKLPLNHVPILNPAIKETAPVKEPSKQPKLSPQGLKLD